MYLKYILFHLIILWLYWIQFIWKTFEAFCHQGSKDMTHKSDPYFLPVWVLFPTVFESCLVLYGQIVRSGVCWTHRHLCRMIRWHWDIWRTVVHPLSEFFTDTPRNMLIVENQFRNRFLAIEIAAPETNHIVPFQNMCISVSYIRCGVEVYRLKQRGLKVSNTLPVLDLTWHYLLGLIVVVSATPLEIQFWMEFHCWNIIC